MYNIKYQQPDILHEPVLFKSIRQIRLSYAPFKVIHYINENDMYSMPTWLIILITVLHTLIGLIGTVTYC